MVEPIWKEVPGYEALYEVSDTGRVRSLERHRKTSHGNQRWLAKELVTFPDSTGYLYVNLSNGKRARKTLVHRIVLLAFVGPQPSGMQACHGDGNRANNIVTNLRWDTVSANALDRNKHGTSTRGDRSPRAKLTEAQALEIINRPENSIALGKLYGVASSTIRAIRLKQNWRHATEVVPK